MSSRSEVPATLSVLADRRDRRLLAFLWDRSEPVTERTLAAEVAAGTGTSRGASPEEVRSARLRLVNASLPKLRSVGLIDWDRAEGTVTTTSHPAFSDTQLEQFLAGDPDELAALATLARHERRRVVLAALAGHDGSAALDDLAVTVAVQERDHAGTDGTDDVLASLYHVHLPALADAGLVEFDPDERTAAYDPPAFDWSPGLEPDGLFSGLALAVETEPVDPQGDHLGVAPDSRS